MKLSPIEVIHEYLEGCADFNTGFDEYKLVRLLNEHGFAIIATEIEMSKPFPALPPLGLTIPKPKYRAPTIQALATWHARINLSEVQSRYWLHTNAFIEFGERYKDFFQRSSSRDGERERAYLNHARMVGSQPAFAVVALRRE